jgi:hypothetical protein
MSPGLEAGARSGQGHNVSEAFELWVLWLATGVPHGVWMQLLQYTCVCVWRRGRLVDGQEWGFQEF